MPESKIALITKALFQKYHNEWIVPHIARKGATKYWGGFRRLIVSANGESVEPEIVSDDSNNLWLNFWGPVDVYASSENDLDITVNVPTMEGATAETTGAPGLVPFQQIADKDKFLKGDGSWAEPSVPIMVGSGAGAAAGLVPTPPSTAGTTKFLCEDGTWKDAGANAVTTDTAQTITGAKEFTVSPTVPTATAGDNTAKVASTSFVQDALATQSVKFDSAQTLTDAQKTQARSNIGSADDSEVVKLTGNQTITGQKTFSKDPIGSSGFSYFPVPNSAAAHNCLFRGIDLSQKYSIAELSAKVQAGDFSDIFIGDYYPMSVTIDGTAYSLTFRVADLDYFYTNGDSTPGKHHIVFVPDQVFMTNQTIMNDSNTTAGGFAGSKAWTTTIPKITTGLQNAFGSSHVLKHRRLLSNAVNTSTASMAGAGFTGAASGWAWADAYACFLNEVMVYGCTAFSSSAYDVADGNHQFALFRLAKEYVSKPRGYWWLSAVASSTGFASVSINGNANYYNASSAESWFGVRPYFLFS
jgi:hypothetical protein